MTCIHLPARHALIAAVAAIAIAAASPAFAGNENSHSHGGWNGEHYWRGNGWGIGAPICFGDLKKS